MRVAFEMFADPGELASVVHPSKVELIPLACGRFTAEFAAVELPRIRLLRTSESLPRLAHVQHPPDRAYFGFLADETSAPVVVDGIAVNSDALLQFGSASNSNQHSFGPTRWSNISIARTDLDALIRDMAEQDPAAYGAKRLVFPGESAIRRLRRLHAEAVALAVHTSATPAEPEAARAMENHLLDAMADCLTGSEQWRPKSVQARRAAVAERFCDLLDANLDRALYLPEVCIALGVSHRALSYCCHDFLGMPPKRYFYMRRMHMVQRELRQADRHGTTVTEVATRFGFWELGRFSVQYKALFGETPSATLRRESCNAADSTWLERPPNAAKPC